MQNNNTNGQNFQKERKGEKSMILSVANPLYDAVFKFLMEDERIAKIVLSALLKKEVVNVEMRRHEYPNVTRDQLSMFRIDFAARIKEPDGSVHLILIELQKTWLETETLRFRRYLAVQYNAEENIQKEGENAGYGIPMVAVYLLGHRIGDVEPPVVYVNRNAVDYDGNEVKNGMSDPFINSLTHDSIIVQIPLLHGKINNRLDKILSVFDQSYCSQSSQQIICLPSENYENDREMMYLLNRLNMAAMSADVRQEMSDEDEFFSVVEARDTQVMKLNKKVSEQITKISEQSNKISEQQAQITEQNVKLKEKEEHLAEKEAQIIAMAQAMHDKGISIHDIASIIKMNEDKLHNLLGC